jgi:hypothetical protein
MQEMVIEANIELSDTGLQPDDDVFMYQQDNDTTATGQDEWQDFEDEGDVEPVDLMYTVYFQG